MGSDTVIKLHTHFKDADRGWHVQIAVWPREQTEPLWFEESLKDFPSSHLIAQLMLVG